MRLDQLVIAVCGFACAAGGVWAASLEASPFLFTQGQGRGQLDALIDGSMSPGLSGDAMEAYAQACMTSFPRLEARFLPPEQKARLVEACVDRLDGMLEASPVNAFLWFARAQLAYDMADWNKLNHSLVQAQVSGPYEFWLASRRFGLARKADAHLEPVTLEHFDKDIVMLAQSTQGSRVLAQEYVAAPQFRPRVTALIEQLSEPVQGEFLENVRGYSDVRGTSL